MTLRIGPASWPPHRPAAHPSEEGGFRLAPRNGVVATASVSLPAGLLAPLDAAMPSARDGLARRRARALLSGLGGLQQGLLAGRADPDALQRLAGLVEGEDGEQPELAEAMRALALRARIELLRHAPARNQPVTTSN